jgi:predicted RNase H-like nuclease
MPTVDLLGHLPKLAGFQKTDGGTWRRSSRLSFRRFVDSPCASFSRRISGLDTADPPLRLDSHPITRHLQDEPSPLNNTAYKHREDLIDAVLCAWTASLWDRHGLSRCQVLGPPASFDQTPVATIIAPATAAQRRDVVRVTSIG